MLSVFKFTQFKLTKRPNQRISFEKKGNNLFLLLLMLLTCVLYGGGGGSSEIFGLNSSSTSGTSCEFNEEDIKLPLHLV